MADQKDDEGRWWIKTRTAYLPPAIYSEQQLAALHAEFDARSNAETSATTVIFASLSAWTGFPCRQGAPVPVVRDGEVVAELQGTIANTLAGITCPAAAILQQAFVPSVQTLKGQKQEVTALLQSLEATLDGIRQISFSSSASLTRTWDERDGPTNKDADVVHAVGLQEAANIALHGMAVNCRRQLRHIEYQLEGLEGRPGRPRDIAAYRVAEGFGKLYAQVTGRRPTYGEGPDGMAGEFTPALRDLFNALGWRGRSLRGPATEAINAITDDIIKSALPIAKKNSMFGLLPALGAELREK